MVKGQITDSLVNALLSKAGGFINDDYELNFDDASTRLKN